MSIPIRLLKTILEWRTVSVAAETLIIACLSPVNSSEGSLWDENQAILYSRHKNTGFLRSPNGGFTRAQVRKIDIDQYCTSTSLQLKNGVL